MKKGPISSLKLAAGGAAFALFALLGIVLFPSVLPARLCISAEELELTGGNQREAVRSKIILLWAQDEGLVDPFVYEDFQGLLEEQNQLRAETRQAGGVVYGPVAYTSRQYYSLLVAECERALRELLLSQAAQDELYAFYQEHQEDYREVDEIQAELSILEEGIVAQQSVVRLGPDNIRALSESDEELVSYLLPLSPGEGAAWRDAYGREKRLVCTARKQGAIPSFEEIQGAVGSQYAYSQFEKELEQRLLKTEVQFIPS